MGETAGVTQDVGSDPTVSSYLYSCTFCGEEIGLLSSEEEDRDDASSLIVTNKVEDLAALMAQLEESEEED